jgi:hypothetical protein
MTSVLFSLEDPDAAGTHLEYQCHVSACTIESEQETLTHETLCPDGSFSALGRETFSVLVTAVQDWTADGLTRFLWEHAGAAAELRFSPTGGAVAADSPIFVCQVTLPRPDVGGEVNTFATTEVTFPVTGVPQLSVTAPTAATDSEQLELEPAAA